MGGSPPCGDSVRAVKDYRRQAITAQKWPSQVEADHQISFSAADTHGISMPHNDLHLIDIGIGKCQVTKVLVDTCSSVDLIFQDTLDKMGVDLRDMKPSSRTLTRFNGSSEKMIGTIRLPVYAGDVTRTVKFSVIRAKAPYNAILGTPWLHSMKAIPSTYHQCVKFPGKDGTTQTIRGDQRAARELLIAAVKLQQSPSLVNAVTKPIHKIHPQKEEILEVPIDEADPSKVVRIGTYLYDDMQSLIISFLKENASTFAWVTTDMKGIGPAITSHELNVDLTFKPIRQKRRKLGPERSKAVNEEVDRLLDAGFIAEVRYPEWLANSVVVKKKNGKWRICVDFTDLNKACPKDRYNQIMMYMDDREKTAFITDRGTFISRSTDKCLPFYELLRGNKRFIWGEKCEEAFNQLKHYLTTPPVLSKPEVGDTLSIYIAVTSSAVSSVLIREDCGEQKPIFYISKRMTEPDTRYPTLEKMALAIITLPLRTVMQNTNQSGRLTKWAVELSEHDIVYKNRTSAKSQVLADFLIELTPELEQDLVLPCLNWILHVDGSSTNKGSKAGVQLQSPTGELIRQSFSFDFAASNNEAKYESLIAGLHLAKAVKAKRVNAYCDSQLVVS
ncbi:PREDICTED: uncharacterized protein LOC106298015 [Brassica oleracea var. oleracea]|uniref:uncharacterized protein LOC106298015 n=1 Tax=Brassica oleracea var. oleracea TaxID=109376 RepID=UPI0006A74434|nr:PREDICTED: uncharacterized protein LOC106298015 [Brassica oleracea var. oleracea]